MAIHAAIKRAFKTPAVIALFAQKEPKALRERLRQLGEDRKLGRIGEEDYNLQSLEIVLALKKLGEEVSDLLACNSAWHAIPWPLSYLAIPPPPHQYFLVPANRSYCRKRKPLWRGHPNPCNNSRRPARSSGRR